jgi:hypothetical protein
VAWRGERGAALLEFALVSLVLYLLLAGAVEFGRMMFGAGALQDAARVAARELALAPVRADATFEYALSCDPAADTDCLADLRRRIFDPACLVVDMNDPAVSGDPDAYFAAMPIVNRVLRTLMITEPSLPNIVRYPGALLSDTIGNGCSAVGPSGAAAPTGLTVGIPLLSADGGSVTWVPVLEEIRAAQDVSCPSRGPFSLVYLGVDDACGTLGEDPVPDRGLAAVRMNYPYQAAMLSGFRPSLPTPDDPLPPNLGNPVIADESALQELNAPPGSLLGDDGAIGTYAGPYGLGRQLALAGQVVRPYRKLISAQSVYRRELFE